MSARLFVYISNQTLSNEVASDFLKSTEKFISTWKAHGTKLDASLILIANRVLFIAVDEQSQTATGCSIDSLNRFLQLSNIDWFTRNWVLYNKDSKSLESNWIIAELNEFHKGLKSGQIPFDLYILNTTVLNVEEARKNLVQPLSESWHMRML
tara:strand:- start:895 stop:1353 length:459 start_codon:yes stop_codon:yes gene_type:complete